MAKGGKGYNFMNVRPGGWSDEDKDDSDEDFYNLDFGLKVTNTIFS